MVTRGKKKYKEGIALEREREREREGEKGVGAGKERIGKTRSG